MLLPNVNSMFKWVNDFFSGASSGGSQDFLQCIRQSDGKILGWIDETGTPRGSLSPEASSGIRALLGNNQYFTSAGYIVDVDDTNLKTSITIPVGYTLAVTFSSGVAECTSTVGYVGFSFDGADWLQEIIPGNTNPSYSPASVTYCFAGDGASHTIAAVFGTFLSGTLAIDAPSLTLILAPSI